MALQAKVASVEAVEVFRAQLIVYTSQARAAVEEISAEVMRTRVWLETEQRTYWEHQLRRRARALEEAQQALFSSRLSSLRHESAAEQMAVHRAKRAVEEGEGKLRLLRTWSRDFESRVQPPLKQMEKLHTFLANDLVKAAAYLGEVVRTLAAYAEGAPPAAASGAAEPARPAAAGPPPTGGSPQKPPGSPA